MCGVVVNTTYDRIIVWLHHWFYTIINDIAVLDIFPCQCIHVSMLLLSVYCNAQ